jgi:hypothetical protein
VPRTADCIEGGYFRASRLGVRRCFYRLGAGWWVYKIEMVLRWLARLTASREATLGRRVSECVVAFTVGGLGGVYKFEMVLRCVVRLTASREVTLGRRVSECVVAFTVWGLCGGCIKWRWS